MKHFLINNKIKVASNSMETLEKWCEEELIDIDTVEEIENIGFFIYSDDLIDDSVLDVRKAKRALKILLPKLDIKYDKLPLMERLNMIRFLREGMNNSTDPYRTYSQILTQYFVEKSSIRN